MSLGINTNNISAIAQYNFVKNTGMLSKSIEKLSSGLRINRAADDGAGLGIANKLDAQARGLGQAIRNANDGVSMMQLADSALEEAVSIMQSIKTKAIQSAQDGQTADSRKVIQDDVDKLLAEFDLLIKSSRYNDLSLLTGNFSHKKFQVGASTGDTLPVSLDSAESNKIGHVRTGQLSITSISGGDVSLSFTSALTGETLSIQSVNISYNNSADYSMRALADAINAYTDETGISGSAVVESTTSDAVQAGATSAAFAINGITIGAVTTLANDADNSLITAINNKTSSHGVTASITSSGALKLVSDDGRPIEVTGAGTSLTVADAADISTFGYINIFQRGPYSLSISDTSSGLAVAFSSNMEISGNVTTTIDSTLAAGSVLGSASTLTAGWETGATLSGGNIDGDIVTTASSTLLAGSVLASDSVVETSSILGGTAYNDPSITTTANSYLESGSVLLSDSIIAAGTYLTNTIYSGGSPISAGTTLTEAKTLSDDATMANDMLILNGSVIASGSTLAAGSYIGGDITLSGSMTMSQDMTLLAGSTIVDTDGVTLITAGSTIGGPATLEESQVTLTQSMTVKSGSVLTSTSSLATGSTIGGASTLEGDHTASQDLLLAAGSVLASDSIIEAGTEFTNSINTTSGIISPGTTSTLDYTTTGSNSLGYSMTLKSGSVLTSSSILAANSSSSVATTLSDEETLRLSDISVLTREDALIAMELADSALNDLNRFRSNVGAIQNQFSSSVSYMTVTKLNLQTAWSSIMDIDFSEETTNFTRMQVLVQSGVYALSQANAVTANVLGLLQGGGTGNSSAS